MRARSEEGALAIRAGPGAAARCVPRCPAAAKGNFLFATEVPPAAAGVPLATSYARRGGGIGAVVAPAPRLTSFGSECRTFLHRLPTGTTPPPTERAWGKQHTTNPPS